MNYLAPIVASAALISSPLTHATNNQIYASIDGGIIQASFNNNYWDQTDVIAQNISDTVLQNGYTGGLAVGYAHAINAQYFLGLELSGHLDSRSALYQSGAANTAFSDEIKMRHHVDLVLVPSLTTASSFNPYMKFGVSFASIQDQLLSPAGFNPVYLQYPTNKQVSGFVAALGVHHAVNEHWGLFSEANYHDYGSLNLASFQNFSAVYSHSSRLCTYDLVVGATYSVNI